MAQRKGGVGAEARLCSQAKRPPKPAPRAYSGLARGSPPSAAYAVVGRGADQGTEGAKSGLCEHRTEASEESRSCGKVSAVARGENRYFQSEGGAQARPDDPLPHDPSKASMATARIFSPMLDHRNQHRSPP